MTQHVLEVKDVCKSFGGLCALDHVAMSIKRGAIYGLIGPNGSGKTTFFNVLTGLYQSDAGLFKLNGKQYQPTSPEKVAHVGIARTFQNIRLFEDMTAIENVMVGRHIHTHANALGAILHTRATRREEKNIHDHAMQLLNFVGIPSYAQYTAKHLSYGAQRRLEIARALAMEPKLLALDEPAAGMNATEKNELRTLIENIRAQGTTVLLIEHDVRLMMGLCDHISVLDYGAIIAHGTPEQVRTDPKVIEAYLGIGAGNE